VLVDASTLRLRPPAPHRADALSAPVL